MHLQLVQNQTYHPPQQLSALLFYSLHQPLNPHHPENLTLPGLFPLPHSPHVHPPSPSLLLSPHLDLHQFSDAVSSSLISPSHLTPSNPRNTAFPLLINILC